MSSQNRPFAAGACERVLERSFREPASDLCSLHVGETALGSGSWVSLGQGWQPGRKTEVMNETSGLLCTVLFTQKRTNNTCIKYMRYIIHNCSNVLKTFASPLAYLPAHLGIHLFKCIKIEIE